MILMSGLSEQSIISVFPASFAGAALTVCVAIRQTAVMAMIFLMVSFITNSPLSFVGFGL